jgi:type II secretory pathway pseudopilin PulG
MSKFRRGPNWGFTTIEAMVTVAMIGIVAALTVPRYQHMVDKSKQSGAVIGLTSVYVAEKNFAAENHSYTTCIGAIGVKGSGGIQWYSYGINGKAVQNSCGISANQQCNVSAWDEGAIVATCTVQVAGNDYVSADRANSASTPIAGADQLAALSTDITATSFVARAAGNIGAVSGYDRWYIDQTGSPVNNVSRF